MACAWSVAPGPLWSEATGQHSATFVLSSRQTCALRGYPEIVMLDARRRPIPFSYSHRGDQMIGARPPRLVRGTHAFFALNKYRCDIRSTAAARYARVRLPGASRWLELQLHRSPVIDYCAEAPSKTIAVSPIVARLRDAAR